MSKERVLLRLLRYIIVIAIVLCLFAALGFYYFFLDEGAEDRQFEYQAPKLQQAMDEQCGEGLTVSRENFRARWDETWVGSAENEELGIKAVCFRANDWTCACEYFPTPSPP